jgi:hypothetical protein
MTKKKVHVSLLLDETGSMETCRDATISGYNEYIQTLQKDKDHNYAFTMTKFDSRYVNTIHDGVPIKDVPKLNRDTYTPGQLTPLYDAIAGAIKVLGKKKNVLFVIVTDGEENASREYSRQQVFDMIKEKTDAGWSFVYLGANQDAYAVGRGIGVPVANTANYDINKTGQTFDAVARGTVSYAASPDVISGFFDDEDLENLVENKSADSK